MEIDKYSTYFLTIYNEKSISKAARKLYITQPSLSQYLIRLEDNLGVKLFERKKNSLEITKEGEIYKDYILKQRLLYDKFCSEIEEYTNLKTSTIKFGIGTWRGSQILPELIEMILKKSKDKLKFKLFEYPVSELTIKLNNGVFDFCLMNAFANNVDDDLICEVINYEKIYLIISKKLIKTLGTEEITLENLTRNAPFISLNENLSVGKAVNNFINKNSVLTNKFISTTNNQTLIELVKKGLGYSFLIETGIYNLKDDDIIVYDLNSKDLIIPLSIIYKKNSYISSVETSFIEEITKFYDDRINKIRNDFDIVILKKE
ncbi:LysR family transcriptional regulator [Peptoniphilus phoceensis]|uniref:LysR family transcriptional regulator n=1 Tax=Peptoniphilus phoceensis TaxID=1720298 RepID=UPI000A52B59D|nr:LysR family transcriptional regulator [Peptoniphilus phoceensis]